MTKRNITEAEALYYQKRDELIKACPPSYIADAPFLFSTRIQTTQVVSRIKLFEMIREMPGSIVECGVYKGNSLLLLLQLSLVMEPYAINRSIYGFDTFEGFRSISEQNDPQDINQSMFSDTEFNLIRDCIELNDIVRPVNRIPRVKLIKGDIVETVPKFVAANKDLCISLLILDTDLYESSKVALQEFLPHMHKGAIVVLDEVCYTKFAGETIAFKEVCNLRDVELRKFPFDTSVGYFRI
jgi:Macrocin-O-methyltransferase (TylF)